MIAVQLYTLRSLLQDPSRTGEVLARVRDIGYAGVEVAGLGPRVVSSFARELERSGLTACASHVSLDRLTTDFDAAAAECSELGCEYVVIPSLPEEYRSEQGYKRFASEAVELAEGLRRHQLQLAYHNHAFELERFGERTGLELILANTPADALLTEPDTYWLQFGGVNAASWISRLTRRVPLVHLKDLAIERGQPVDAEVGVGNLDWPEILKACRDAGARWLIVEQDAPRRDPMDSVAISYRNLTALLDAAGAGV